MNVTIKDFAPLATTSRSYTPNGFLKAKALIARTGIQEYFGFELGLTDEPLKKVRIYRPESVVFDDAVLNSCLGLDITNDHPSVDVNAETYKALTCGCVTSKGERSAEQPEYIVCDILVKDKQAIQDIESGKSELSAGYQSRCVLTDGVTPDGEHYDGLIEDIILNHVAIVEKGRAGNARILDHEGVSGMKRTLILGDKEVEFVAESSDIEDAFKAMTEEAETIKTQLADAQTARADLEAKLADTQAELEAVKAQVLTDAQINELVKQIADAQTKARTLCGEGFVCDSVNPVEIKRQALAVVFPKSDFADKSNDYIEARFDASLEAQVEVEASRKALADALKKQEKTESVNADPAEAFAKKTADAWKNK